jgi:hypothetical protein
MCHTFPPSFTFIILFRHSSLSSSHYPQSHSTTEAEFTLVRDTKAFILNEGSQADFIETYENTEQFLGHKY